MLSPTSVLQHGSLPVVSPSGEKLPHNSYQDSRWSIKAQFNVTTNNVTMESTLINPKPGPWYSVAFLPEADGKILPDVSRPSTWLFVIKQ